MRAQALNLDCARFFELYHASRESFLYLRDFYRGELHPEESVPQPQEPPSSDFLAQLREFTEAWRLPVAAPQPGEHLHLGVTRHTLGQAGR